MKSKTILLALLVVAVAVAGCTGQDKADTGDEGVEGAVCGDGECAASESSDTCPEDCGEGSEEEESLPSPPMPPG
ncbi:MAG: hypothetical protein SVV03_06340 [Candidatus Nanohaloarchaea archaeon]|nr:hypothetical protein [Candidatus Nanohaloarchaea archaeon]